MKLSTRVRRATAAADSAPDRTPGQAPEAPPPPPGPPRGSPVAAYAGVLDGHTLWLAVEPTAGTLALRDAEGDVHPLHSDLPEDDPAYRSVRADLLDLPGDAEGGYDVVVVRGSGRAPRTVWTAPFARTLARIPPAPDGRWQFALARTDEGMLRVRRSRPAPGLEVLDLAVDETGIRIAFAATDATELRLVADGTELASYPVIRDGDRAAAVLTGPELEEDTDQVAQLLVGDLPLRRRRNDLANAQQAVLLPVLFGDDPEHARVRLRWSPDGALVARLVDSEVEPS